MNVYLIFVFITGKLDSVMRSCIPQNAASLLKYPGCNKSNHYTDIVIMCACDQHLCNTAALVNTKAHALLLLLTLCLTWYQHGYHVVDS